MANSRKDVRNAKKDARKDAREEKKDVRQDAREEKKDAREEKRDAMREIRKSDLSGEKKRDAKKEVREEKRDSIDVAKDEKKEGIDQAKEDKERDLAAADPFDYTHEQKKEIDARTKAVLDHYGDDRKGTWFGYCHVNRVHPREISHVRSLRQIKDLVARAAREKANVKAVGSGHSFSDIYATDGFLVDTHEINSVLPVDALRLKSKLVGFDGSAVLRRHLFHLEAGMRIEKLNQELDRRELGIFNMGAYDGQTFAGASSTSTHGTGIELPPLPDMILSLVLVTEDGQAVRIEPSAGITEPKKWSEPDVDRLIQDDEVFSSVIVSMGCMGVIYSYVIQVRDAYALEELKERLPWKDVHERLAKNGGYGAGMRENRHFDVLVNPYIARSGIGPDKDERQCIVSKRNITDKKRIHLHETRGIRGLEMCLARDIKFKDPEGAAGAINTAFRMIDKKYINVGHRVFLIGGDTVGGYACEWGFRMDRYLEAMDKVIEVVNQAAGDGAQVATSPISLRFIRASRAYLSPMYGRDTCMIEMPMLYGTPGRPGDYELMHRYHRALIALDGRPHWGLEFNDLVNDNGLMARLYPEFKRWTRVFRRLCPNGRFRNSFTERMRL